jgi:RimJ/RimL family protein N-acetyltransferase
MSVSRTIVETARLCVRRLAAEDIAPLARLWADPEVTRFMGGPREIETVTASLRGVLEAANPPQWDLWPLIEKTSGTVVGHCGLLPKRVDARDEIELVYVIARDAWGRGYATEAACAVRDHASQALGLLRLIALIDPAHAASARVAVKAGMKFEGPTLRPTGRTLHVYAATNRPRGHP